MSTFNDVIVRNKITTSKHEDIDEELIKLYKTEYVESLFEMCTNINSGISSDRHEVNVSIFGKIAMLRFNIRYASEIPQYSLILTIPEEYTPFKNCLIYNSTLYSFSTEGVISNQQKIAANSWFQTTFTYILK